MDVTERPTTELFSIKLLSHASVKITAASVVILTDPWFFGGVFNNGWRLSPEPDIDDLKKDLTDVTHIWISHEHPDHLHFLSLRFLLDEVGLNDVKILFQKTNSDKVFDALRKLGYKNFLPLPHLNATKIHKSIDVFSYGHRHLDSCLGIRVKGLNWILNINDTELNAKDCDIIRAQFGKFPLLLNQYSIAGFEGIYDADKINNEKSTVLSKMLFHHRVLSGGYTIPFASLMYFCKPDNEAFNAYRNTVFDALRAFESAGANLLLLKPQGTPSIWNIDQSAPSNIEATITESTTFFKAHYHTEKLTIDASDASVPFDVIKHVAEDRMASWRRKTFDLILKKMGIIDFWVEDLQISISVDFHAASMQKTSISPQKADIVIHSQPLHFAFATPFGFQSLGVSGRYRFADHIQEIPLRWKLVRIISSLANAELYLGWGVLFSRNSYKWVWSRRKGLLSQIGQQFRRFKS
jgi:hypothetical protein